LSSTDLIHAFSYEDDTHTYRNQQGTVRPSVTQILKDMGIFDYSHIDPEILERKRRIGSNIHQWTADYDRNGSVNENCVAAEELGYFEGWLRFRRESKVVLDEIAQPILKSIMGVELGGRPDRTGYLGETKYVLDIKTCTTRHPGWALQLALYEMLLTGIPRCGRMGRMVVQLFPNGNYETFCMETPSDAGAAISALMLAAWKQNNGIKLVASRERKYVAD
jgi:hypothetical protein